MKKRAAIFLLLLLFICAGYLIDNTDLFGSPRAAMQNRTVPVSILRYGTMGKILRSLNLTQTVSSHEALSPETAFGELQAKIFPRKRRAGYFWEGQKREYLYQANSGGLSALPSSTVIGKADFREGWPLLSVFVDHEGLYDERTGIIARRERKGRNWERLAYVSYFDKEKLVFATSAGVRYHAGHRKSDFLKGLRVYFRNYYGIPSVPADKVFEGADYPLRTLVVRRAKPFINSLAFDIARRAGASAPEMKPVMFFLNGRYMGVYSLSKHLSRRQYVAELGHEDFVFLKYKGENWPTATKIWKDFRRWVIETGPAMTVRTVSTKIDLDNYFRHLFSIMFCGESDWRQGIVIQDRSESRPLWRWTGWDMDLSFSEGRYRHTKNPPRPPWKMETVEILMIQRKLWMKAVSKTSDIRSTLFKRLWSEDPSFRFNFARFSMDILNHLVTDDFLAQRIAHYKGMFLEPSDRGHHGKLSYAEKFLDRRRDYFFERLSAFTGKRRIHTAEVKGPAGAGIIIDGYPEDSRYRGRYFDGERIRIDLDQNARRDFSHWVVNGVPVYGMPLELSIDREFFIEAVHRGALEGTRG